MTLEPKQFSYTGDPSVNPRDAVRFLLGDTDKDRRLLDDREIDYALANEGSVDGAAVLCGTSIANRFASRADISIGPISKSYSSVANAMRQQVNEIKERAGLSLAPAFPALTYSGKCDLNSDPDTIRGSFYRGMSDHIGTMHRELSVIGFYGW